jgi:hypothetical protein
LPTLGREQLLHRILIWLVLYTTIISVFNLAYSGNITLADMSAVGGGTIPGQISVYNQGMNTGGTYIESANTASGTSVTGIDFTTGSPIDPNITTLIGGTWTVVGGTGLMLTGLPAFGIDPILNPSVVLVRNAQSVNGVYTINAKVDNSNAGGSFYVYPRFITGYSGSDLKVVFASDGIHIKKFPLYLGIFDNGDDYLYPMTGAQSATGSTITTKLTEAVSTKNENTPDYTAQLTVIKDGSTLFTTSVRSILPGNNINDQVRHGGIGSDTINFVVMGFPGTHVLDTSATIISGTNPAANDPLSSASNVLTLFLTALGVTSGALVPFWLWAIIGLPCLAVLVFIYLEVLRGD